MTAPRAFWQIHLSTAIIVVLVSGTVLGINMRPPRVVYAVVQHTDETGGRWILVLYESGGWPFGEVKRSLYYCEAERKGWSVSDFAQTELDLSLKKRIPTGFDLKNFCVAAVIVLSITAACEFLIRRRESWFH